MLTKFSTFRDKITSNNSRLYKKTVLAEYSHDDDVMYLLEFIYNPFIVTGISKKKIMKKCLPLKPFEDVKSLLEYIKQNNTGTDDVLGRIRGTKRHLGLPDDPLDGIITKSITLGIDVKTINSVIPNFIPEFNVQLANSYFENQAAVNTEFTLTTKIDGARIIAMKDTDGTVHFWARSGKQYIGLVELEAEFATRMPNNICLDGELVVTKKTKNTYTETMKIIRLNGPKKGLQMLVFDCMTAEEFKNQNCDKPYIQRRAMLESIVASDCKYFHVLPVLYRGTDTDKITTFLNKAIMEGEEGIMVNLDNAKYEFKRSNTLLKVKRMHDIDLRVIGFEEGDGKYTGMLGSIIVQYKNTPVKVGSGMSYDFRTHVWNHKDDYLGRIATIQYFEFTKDNSLRFPVFIDFRDDKDEPDA